MWPAMPSSKPHFEKRRNAAARRCLRWRRSPSTLSKVGGRGIRSSAMAQMVRGRHAECRLRDMTSPKLFVTLDAVEPSAQAAFWSAALGRELGKAGIGWLIMEGPGFGLALQPVDEPKVGKNRAHIDLHVDDLDAEVARLVDLGAIPVGGVLEQGGTTWQVLTDPEGNELCACCSPDLAGVPGVVLDCADPGALAPFWAGALGYKVLGEFGPYAVLRGEPREAQLLLQRVDEPKTT